MKAFALFLLALCLPASGADPVYPWLEKRDPAHALARRIPAPEAYTRAPAQKGSFAAWLRNLPLKPGRPPVRLHDGSRKANQAAHAAVVDLDVGRRDLQQCADAVIRLRAEYLYAAGRPDAIGFHFTSGDRADFARWAKGSRPVVRGSRVTWRRSAAADASHASLRRYLDTVFTYAGSHSLSRELKPRPVERMQIGDVFIRGGFPGHAVIVVDMAVRPLTGGKAFLLAQSYMPAQELHILKNPGDAAKSPWYDLAFGDTLRTPEWTFKRGDLKHFPE